VLLALYALSMACLIGAVLVLVLWANR